MGMTSTRLIYKVADAIIANKILLTELDREIGDADHGINMERGFLAVKKKLEGSQEEDLSILLKTIGMTLVGTVGGASGPLYGTAFLRAAASAKGKSEITKELVVTMFQAALTGIKERGKAVCGEKTMIDALEPAVIALEKESKDGRSWTECLEIALRKAEEGLEYTKTIKATKGRASYLGERSIGHQDPGATSVCIMLQALLTYCQEEGLELTT